MSDRTSATALDDRAAAAARDLRTLAASRPTPAFDPEVAPVLDLPAEPPPDARRWLPLAAAAAAALLVAGAATALVLDRGDGQVTSSVDPIRPFVATDLPDDLAFAGAADLGGGAAAGPRLAGPIAVYADGDGPPALGVVVLPGYDADAAAALAEDGTPVEVPGGATAYDLTASGSASAQLLVLVGTDAVLLVSPVLDVDALAATAAGIAVDDEVAVLADGALPAGWRHLGTEDGARSLLWPMASLQGLPGDDDAGAAAVYLDAAQERVLVVESSPGSELLLEATALVAETTEELVDGRRALLATYAVDDLGSTIRTLAWRTAQGELVRVSGIDLTAEELLAVAAGVEPVPADEWRDLVRRTQLGDFSVEPDDGAGGGPVTTVEVGRGAFPDGTEWVLWAQEEGDDVFVDLGVTVSGIDGSSSSSTGGPGDDRPPLYAHVETGAGDRRFAGGLVSDEVAHLVFLDVAGAVVGEADPVVGAGYRGWVTEYVGSIVVVAQDATGAELARVEISPSASSGSSTEATVETEVTQADG
jgi:hypothetical protein